MDHISAIIHRWLGLCPKAPCKQTAPSVFMCSMESISPGRPDYRGPSSAQEGFREGVRIAAESLKTMIRDQQMLWFSFLSGILLFILFALMYWIRTLYYDPWTRTISYNPFSIRIHFGDFILGFDLQLFLVLAFCLFCFIMLMADIILYRNAHSGRSLTLRERCAGLRAHAGPLAILSVAMALAGTILSGLLDGSWISDSIIALRNALLPYFNFLPVQIDFTITLFAMVLIIYAILFFLTLYVVPGIVLENRGLIPALAGSIACMRKTWRQLLGCILIYGVIAAGVALTALAIGQSHVLLNYDYSYLLANNLLPLLTTCSEILLLCFIIIVAVGSTAADVAIADLYRIGAGEIAGISRDECMKRPGHEI